MTRLTLPTTFNVLQRNEIARHLDAVAEVADLVRASASREMSAKVEGDGQWLLTQQE